jgi:ferric-dicitrate binding protein FerR (iron transport regulator)
MENKSRHIIPYELFIKFLNNELNEDEDITLKSWLKANPDHPAILDEYKHTWDLMEKVEDVANINLDKEWAKQKNAIGSTEDNDIYPLESSKSRFQWSFLRVAAVFLVLIVSALALYYIFPKFTQQKIASQTEIRELNLPDGSEVTLNTNSRIKYPTSFDTKERRVFIEGEAYFKVVHNPDAPFRIQTENANIEVLGTSFNVTAYKDQENIEVVVAEGTVALSSKDNPDNMIILEKGSRGMLDLSNNYLLKKANSDRNYLAWKTRRIVFDNDSLSLVLNTLEKVYDRNIILADQNLGHCTLTVTFENQTFESVLNVIESTLNIELKEEDNQIVVSGEGC